MMKGLGPEVVFGKASLNLDERFEFKVGIIGRGRGRFPAGSEEENNPPFVLLPQLLPDGVNLTGGFLLVPGDGF